MTLSWTTAAPKGRKAMARWPPSVLRPAGLADLEAVYQLEDACFKERRFQRDHVQWILTNPSALTLVEDGGRDLLGAVMLLFEGRVCRILSIAVISEARRRRLGSAMMREAERIAAARGCVVVRLEVSTRNVGAVEFYRRLGYEVDGFLPRYYSWGEDAHSMRRRIPVVAEAPANP